MSPVGAIFVPFPPKTGTNMLHPLPPKSLNLSDDRAGLRGYVQFNKYTHTHTHTHTPWEDQREWHRMTRMTRPDCAVMCNLINTHTHTHTDKVRLPKLKE